MDYEKDYALGYAYMSEIEIPYDCEDPVEFMNGFYKSRKDSIVKRFDKGKSIPCGDGWIPAHKKCRLKGGARKALKANATGKIPGMRRRKGRLSGRTMAAGAGVGAAIGAAALGGKALYDNREKIGKGARQLKRKALVETEKAKRKTQAAAQEIEGSVKSKISKESNKLRRKALVETEKAKRTTQAAAQKIEGSVRGGIQNATNAINEKRAKSERRRAAMERLQRMKKNKK